MTLPPITKTIQVRRTRHSGHSWRSRNELISDVLQWTPTYGQAKAGRPERTYIRQLCEDTGCSPEDLQRQWTIGKSDERGSGISVLAARHDDDHTQAEYSTAPVDKVDLNSTCRFYYFPRLKLSTFQFEQSDDLIGVYGISTIGGYLMPNLAFTYILSLWFVNTFCRYTQLNDETVLFQTIQFSRSHLFALSLNVKHFCLTHR